MAGILTNKALQSSTMRVHTRHRQLACRPQAFFGFLKPKAPQPPPVKKTARLLEAIDGANKGLATTKAQLEQIESAVVQLEETSEDLVTTDDNLSATWRLLFTTEQETLFILKNAGLFGTQAGEVYQVIDVESERLQNVITFPPEGAFIVDSSLQVEGPQRMNFQFSSATLKLPRRDIKLPPFGKGWFESVYMDEDIRVARDIRGDLLIVARDGPPRIFE